MVSGCLTGELDILLEADLFDFASGELIWAAQTETVNLNQLRISHPVFLPNWWKTWQKARFSIENIWTDTGN
jgi:hypothetical protein